MRLSSARVIRPPRTPVRRDVLPLAAAGLAAVVAASVYWLGPPGVDTPAHLFQTWLYRHQGFVWWNNDWYSGRYVFVAYSVLFYPLAAKVGIGALAVFAAAVMSAATAWVMVARYGFKAALAPALLLAVVAPYNMMVSGAYPFLCGAAAMAVALACVAARLAARIRRRGAGDAGLLAARAGAAGGGDGRGGVRRRPVLDARPPPGRAGGLCLRARTGGDGAAPLLRRHLLPLRRRRSAGDRRVLCRRIPGGRHRQGGPVAAGHVRDLPGGERSGLHDQRPGGSQRRQAVCRGRHAAACCSRETSPVAAHR